MVTMVSVTETCKYLIDDKQVVFSVHFAVCKIKLISKITGILYGHQSQITP